MTDAFDTIDGCQACLTKNVITEIRYLRQFVRIAAPHQQLRLQICGYESWISFWRTVAPRAMPGIQIIILNLNLHAMQFLILILTFIQRMVLGCRVVSELRFVTQTIDGIKIFFHKVSSFLELPELWRRQLLWQPVRVRVNRIERVRKIHNHNYLDIRPPDWS